MRYSFLKEPIADCRPMAAVIPSPASISLSSAQTKRKRDLLCTLREHKACQTDKPLQYPKVVDKPLQYPKVVISSGKRNEWCENSGAPKRHPLSLPWRQGRFPEEKSAWSLVEPEVHRGNDTSWVPMDFQ